MPTYKDPQGNRHEIPSSEFEHLLPPGSVEMLEIELSVPYKHPELSLELQIANKEAKGMSPRRLREAIIAGTLVNDMVTLEADIGMARNALKNRKG
jgi:hypothetical protein